MRALIFAVVAAAGLVAMQGTAVADCMYGCCSRPACGKVCKLVCETKKLTAVGYGSECDSICIPARSRQGCKHCYVTCCADGECGPECECPCGECTEQNPRIEFCWYDWFACGCAKPRTIRLLTKYQAEKEVCSYHWEVVDACESCCPCGCCANGCHSPNCKCVYKAAPPEANIGAVLELTPEDLSELAPIIAGEPHSTGTQVAEAADVGVETAGATSGPDASLITPAAAESESSVFVRFREALRLPGESQ